MTKPDMPLVMDAIPETDFPHWDVLVAATIARYRQREIGQIRITQKLDQALFLAAQQWLPYKPVSRDTFLTPWGQYKFTFVVWAVQAAKWELPEFLEGRDHALTAETLIGQSPYKDAYREITWRFGYLSALPERENQDALKVGSAN